MSATKSKKVNTKMYESLGVSKVLKYNPSLLSNSSVSNNINKPFRIIKIEAHNKTSS